MTEFGTAISNPHSFHLEARHQRVCARRECQRGGKFHAHHVVPRSWLRKNRLPQFDTRGALRLCDECHMQFEWAGPGKLQVVTAELTQDNLCYVWEVMRLSGIDFLKREYGSADDPRFACHIDGLCLACQLHT